MATNLEQASSLTNIDIPGWPGYQLKGGQLFRNGHVTRWLYDSKLGFKILTHAGFESCARIIAAVKYGDKLPEGIEVVYKDGQNFNCQLSNLEIVTND